MDEMQKRLKEPFKANDIEWRVQRSGIYNGKPWAMVLAYISARAVQDRLDEVVGPQFWQTDIRVDNGAYLYGIGIHSDDLHSGKEWIWKWDGSDATKVEAVKGAISGGLKRAAVLWGIGRYLYDIENCFAIFCEKGKGRYNSKIEGKTYYWNPPTLPAWALPSPKPVSDKPKNQAPGKNSPGQDKSSQTDAGVGKGSEKKVDSEASQEVKPEVTPEKTPPTWEPTEWWKKYQSLRSGNSLMKKISEDVHSGILRTVFRKFPEHRDRLFDTWGIMQKKGQIDQDLTLGQFLIKKGFTPPTLEQGSLKDVNPDTVNEVNEIFGGDNTGTPGISRSLDFDKEIDSRLQKAREGNSEIKDLLIMANFNTFFSEKAQEKNITEADLEGRILDFCKIDPVVFDRMMLEFVAWAKEM